MKTDENGSVTTLFKDSLATGQQGDCLATRIELEELLYHYARSVDSLTPKEVAGCFLPDGAFIGADDARPIRSRRLIEKIFNALTDPHLESSIHCITNIQVGQLSDSEALCYAYFIAHKSFDDGRPCESTYGGYEVHARRDEDGEWRIAEMKVFFTYQDGNESRRAEQLGRPWPPAPEQPRTGVTAWENPE